MSLLVRRLHKRLAQSARRRYIRQAVSQLTTDLVSLKDLILGVNMIMSLWNLTGAFGAEASVEFQSDQTILSPYLMSSGGKPFKALWIKAQDFLYVSLLAGCMTKSSAFPLQYV